MRGIVAALAAGGAVTAMVAGLLLVPARVLGPGDEVALPRRSAVPRTPSAVEATIPPRVERVPKPARQRAAPPRLETPRPAPHPVAVRAAAPVEAPAPVAAPLARSVAERQPASSREQTEKQSAQVEPCRRGAVGSRPLAPDREEGARQHEGPRRAEAREEGEAPEGRLPEACRACRRHVFRRDRQNAPVPRLTRLVTRKAGPLGLALTAFELWSRLPERQRRQIVEQTRKHGPRIAARAVSEGKTRLRKRGA